jgi:hypothetical protein
MVFVAVLVVAARTRCVGFGGAVWETWTACSYERIHSVRKIFGSFISRTPNHDLGSLLEVLSTSHWFPTGGVPHEGVGRPESGGDTSQRVYGAGRELGRCTGPTKYPKCENVRRVQM